MSLFKRKLQKLTAKINRKCFAIQDAVETKASQAMSVLQDKAGEGVISFLIVVVIVVVLGGIVLAALIKIFGNENEGILEQVKNKIMDFFN